MSDEQSKTLREIADVASSVIGGPSLGSFGSTLLTDDHGTWDPVLPADVHLNPLPPVAEDGTAECWQCHARFAFAQLDIAGNAYACRPCLLRTAQANASLAPPIEDIKLEHSWVRTIAIVGTMLALIGMAVIIYVMRQP